jgi:hypothetical protein
MLKLRYGGRHWLKFEHSSKKILALIPLYNRFRYPLGYPLRKDTLRHRMMPWLLLFPAFLRFFKTPDFARFCLLDAHAVYTAKPRFVSLTRHLASPPQPPCSPQHELKPKGHICPLAGREAERVSPAKDLELFALRCSFLRPPYPRSVGPPSVSNCQDFGRLKGAEKWLSPPSPGKPFHRANGDAIGVKVCLTAMGSWKMGKPRHPRHGKKVRPKFNEPLGIGPFDEGSGGVRTMG